jgi:hypothetical protein
VSLIEPGSPPARTFEAERLTRPWRRVAVGFGVAVFEVYAVALSVEDPTTQPTLMIIAAAMMVTLGGLVFLLQKVERPRSRPVRLEAGPRALRVSDGRPLPTARVVSAFVAPSTEGGLVTIQERWRRHSFRLRTVAEAEALLTALALTPSARAMVFPLATSAVTSLSFLVPFGLIAGVLSALAVHFHVTFLRGAMVVLPGALIFATRWSRTVTVARDGLRVRAGLGSTPAFVSFADVSTVEQRRKSEVTVVLNDGKAVRLLVAGWRHLDSGHSSVEIVSFAIRSALDAWRERAATQSVAHAAAIVGASDGGAAHYRVSSVPRERLLDLAEDPTADVKIRVTAVEALGADGDDDTRARLEQVAATSASPELRRALRTATRR